MSNDQEAVVAVPATSHAASAAVLWSAPNVLDYQHPRVVVPRWRYEAFQRWFVPAEDRDGVDTFVGRAWRAPGS
jgi:hypothetical protein